MFGPDDKSLAVAGSDGYAGRWALPSFAPKMESVQDDTGLSSFDSIDYFGHEKDIHQIVLAGGVRDENAKGQPPGLDSVKVLRVLNTQDEE